MSQYTKMWRSLLRIETIAFDYVTAILPGWSSNTPISFPLKDIPENLRPLVVGDAHFIVQANIGAEKASDIRISGWEMPHGPFNILRSYYGIKPEEKILENVDVTTALEYLNKSISTNLYFDYPQEIIKEF